MEKFILKHFLTVFLCVSVFWTSFATTVFSAAVVDWWSDFFVQSAPLVQIITEIANNKKFNDFSKHSSCVAQWRKVIKQYNIPKDDLRELFDICWNADSNLFISKYGDSAYNNYFDVCQNLVKVTISTLNSDIDDFFNVELYSEDGADLDDDNNVVVPADKFNDYIKQTDKLFFPKNATGMLSYRTDERFHNKFDDTQARYTGDLAIYESQWGCFPVGGGNEMYLIFFLQQGSDTYYGKYQFHFTVTTEDHWYTDRDEVEYTGYTLSYEVWDMIDGSADRPTTGVIFEDSKHSYFTFFVDGFNHCYFFRSFSTYDDYINYINFDSSNHFKSILPSSSAFIAFLPDLSLSVDFYSCLFDHFKGSLSNHDGYCTDFGSAHDVGYVASASPISSLYNIDTNKIPDNYNVVINNDNSSAVGDTVYNYTIVDPETGKKDTIQNFITNNYNFNVGGGGGDIDLPGGGSDSGGSLSGDVSVGGNVGVNGSVEIGGKVDVGVDVTVSVPDININVNSGNGDSGGSGGDSSGNSGSDSSGYEMPDTEFFNGYLDDALDESSGIRRFIADFFGTLPGQITTLICIGLVISILLRIISR